jgi:uncharacterized protein (DUF983 family)
MTGNFSSECISQVFQKWQHILHVLWVGLTLRCPACERGRTFNGLFSVNKTCPNCGVRFERQDGESVGGMYFNLGLAEMTALGGFFLVHYLFQPPILPHLVFWLIYNILFCTLFYRHARSLWMAISYLTGGVYRDSDLQSD